MKKILIAVATVAVGLCASAATYNWKAYNDAFSPDGENPLVGTAYFFDANAYALSIVTDSLGSTGTTVLANALGSQVLEEGGFIMQGSGMSDNGSTTSLQASGYIVVISSDEKNYWASDVATIDVTDAIKGGALASFSFGENYSTTWQGSVSNVPEPTSGLLMLIGLAGLALKRKRM